MKICITYVHHQKKNPQKNKMYVDWQQKFLGCIIKFRQNESHSAWFDLFILFLFVVVSRHILVFMQNWSIRAASAQGERKRCVRQAVSNMLSVVCDAELWRGFCRLQPSLITHVSETGELHYCPERMNRSHTINRTTV